MATDRLAINCRYVSCSELGGDLYDYAAMSGGRVALGAGTLYGALNTLCARGWIEPAASDARRKEYQLAQAGRAALRAEVRRLGELYQNGIHILGGKDDAQA